MFFFFQKQISMPNRRIQNKISFSPRTISRSERLKHQNFKIKYNQVLNDGRNLCATLEYLCMATIVGYVAAL